MNLARPGAQMSTGPGGTAPRAVVDLPETDEGTNPMLDKLTEVDVFWLCLVALFVVLLLGYGLMGTIEKFAPRRAVEDPANEKLTDYAHDTYQLLEQMAADLTRIGNVLDRIEVAGAEDRLNR